MIIIHQSGIWEQGSPPQQPTNEGCTKLETRKCKQKNTSFLPLTLTLRWSVYIHARTHMQPAINIQMTQTQQQQQTVVVAGGGRGRSGALTMAIIVSIISFCCGMWPMLFSLAGVCLALAVSVYAIYPFPLHPRPPPSDPLPPVPPGPLHPLTPPFA